jgi:class 3 adenylate cyclase
VLADIQRLSSVFTRKRFADRTPYVRFWHFADKRTHPSNGRYWGHSGQTRALALTGLAVNDPKRTWHRRWNLVRLSLVVNTQGAKHLGGDMRRRGKAGGEPTESRLPRTVTPKARKKPAISVLTEQSPGQFKRLQRERDEALEQQTAMSEVLRVISSSPGGLDPVFKMILENASRLCDANFGTLALYEGDAFRIVALHDAPIALRDERQPQPIIRPKRGHHLLRLLETKKPVHIADILADPALAPTLAKFASARTLLSIPMLKENDLVGAIAIYRQEVRPFTDRQIEIVKNFAAQAVIAIENARLLNELNEMNQQLEQRVADQVGEIERTGRLRRFLPPQVADLIVASGTEKQLESHRGEITALFCDLRGFTGFSESADPEDVMALLRDYHAAIGEIINKYGGTLERYAGDGVMVVFNDPIPIDNPALQAVLMAIDMRAAIGNLIERWRKLGHDIGFGIGIAHGFATLGTIGFEGRFDYAAIGTVSNVASRLCDEAKPGQILISPRVLMAVENDVVVEPMGEFELKGIRRPMSAYNLQSARTPKISHE